LGEIAQRGDRRLPLSRLVGKSGRELLRRRAQRRQAGGAAGGNGEAYVTLGLVAELPVSLKGIVGPVSPITRRNHARSPAAEAFLGILRSVARELHAR
jgi:hypothetical protein